MDLRTNGEIAIGGNANIQNMTINKIIKEIINDNDKIIYYPKIEIEGKGLIEVHYSNGKNISSSSSWKKFIIRFDISMYRIFTVQLLEEMHIFHIANYGFDKITVKNNENQMSIDKSNNNLTDSIFFNLYNKRLTIGKIAINKDIQWAHSIPFTLIHESNLIKE